MHIKNTAIAGFVSALFLMGCSSSGDPDDSGQTSMPAPGSELGDPQPIVISRFNGNYFLDCQLSEDDDEIWETIEVAVQDDTATRILTEYSDADCTQPDLTFTTDFSIEYPGGTVTTSLGVADFTNLTTESAAINGQAVPSDGQMFFDLALLVGDTLYYGLFTDELDGLTAETRPVDVDVNTRFERQ